MYSSHPTPPPAPTLSLGARSGACGGHSDKTAIRGAHHTSHASPPLRRIVYSLSHVTPPSGLWGSLQYGRPPLAVFTMVCLRETRTLSM